MECRGQLSEETAMTRDFKAKNKIGENIVLSTSAPVLVKQGCLQSRGTEKKRTNKMVPCISRVSLHSSPLLRASIFQFCFPFQEECNSTSKEI